jgi:formate dehydrogenase major subunit
MTSRTANNLLRPHDCVDVSAEDAGRLGLSEGSHVRISSRYGEAVLPIKIENAVRPGELFATFHTPEAFVNNVTSLRRDNYVSTPEYKVTAVRLEKV